MNYYEKHIGDFIRDTVSLTMTEDGAYNRLIDQAYQTERPLPLDKKLVYRLARATSTADRKAVDFVLSSFFKETPEGYVQKRIALEIDRYQEKQRKAQASANARWSKTKPDANASQTHDALDMRTHCEGNAHQSPDTSIPTPTQNPDSGGATTADREPPPGHPAAAPLPPREESPPSSDPAITMSVALRKLGVSALYTHPTIQAWTAASVPMEILEAAVRQARESKEGNIPTNYLVPIVNELLNPKGSAPMVLVRPMQAGKDYL